MPLRSVILIIDDDPEQRSFLKLLLEEDGHRVLSAASATEMRDHLPEKPDVILLDLMLSDVNGQTLITEIKDFCDAKIIIVSAKKNLTDKIVSLELGADDYITKPFNSDELIARVHARIRRHKAIKKYQETINSLKMEASEHTRLKFGNWILDKSHWQAFSVDGRSAQLTPREFLILESLVSAKNKVLTRNQIIEKAWQQNNNTTDRAVDIQVLRIRKKIADTADDNEIIKSVRGVGYQIVPKVDKIE